MKLGSGAVFLLAVSLLLPGGRSAPAAEPDNFLLGVGVHISSSNLEPSLSMLGQMGCKSLRTDIAWSQIEKSKGVLLMPDYYVRFVDRCVDLHISPILILDYSNVNYGSGYPVDPAAIAAYQRYAEFVVRTFQGKVRYVEIWNEWNWGTGMPKAAGKGAPADYVRLISHVSPALRQIDLNLIILGGGMAASGELSGDDWLKEALGLGLGRYVDGLSIHPYCYSLPKPARTPETGFRERLQNVSAILDANPETKTLALYITEIGWPSHTDKNGTPVETVAEYVPRAIAVARGFARCKGLWWYDWRDDGTDPANVEDNFGLETYDLKPKPAGISFAAECKKE